jgi:hypothetical protein
MLQFFMWTCCAQQLYRWGRLAEPCRGLNGDDDCVVPGVSSSWSVRLKGKVRAMQAACSLMLRRAWRFGRHSQVSIIQSS